MRIWVNILLQKVEAKICVEKDLYSLIPCEMVLVIRLLERNIEESGEARVSHEEENPHVKVTLPRAICTDDELILPGALLAFEAFIGLAVVL
jgi:hypothetical protein